LRTPAPVRAAPPSWGRHPQTFTEAAIHPGSLFLGSDNKKQKATRALHRMAFARLSP
jgi:hypothetical protein